MASKGTRYSEEQIIRILKEVKSGITMAEDEAREGAALEWAEATVGDGGDAPW